MPTKKLSRSNQAFYEKLARRISKMILTDRGYSSLDAFSLEHHNSISKPTLYGLCAGKRDVKVSTLRGLAKALGMSLEDLISGL